MKVLHSIYLTENGLNKMHMLGLIMREKVQISVDLGLIWFMPWYINFCRDTLCFTKKLLHLFYGDVHSYGLNIVLLCCKNILETFVW